MSQKKSNLIYITLYAIWYHLHNSENVKNIHGGLTLPVKLQAKVKSEAGTEVFCKK